MRDDHKTSGSLQWTGQATWKQALPVAKQIAPSLASVPSISLVPLFRGTTTFALGELPLADALELRTTTRRGEVRVVLEDDTLPV